MDNLANELTTGWPDVKAFTRVLIRLLAAAMFGAIIGFQRQRAHKAAGLRTHMLVALGVALFVVACLESGMSSADLSRVIQGLATGIGFIGAGAILKIAEEREITGLTTAASIWLTAGIGVAAALGSWASAAISFLLTWIILVVLGRLEWQLQKRPEAQGEHKQE